MYVTRVKEACICITLSMIDFPIDFSYRCYRVRTQDFVDRILLKKTKNFNTILCTYHIVMRHTNNIIIIVTTQ